MVNEVEHAVRLTVWCLLLAAGPAAELHQGGAVHRHRVCDVRKAEGGAGCGAAHQLLIRRVAPVPDQALPSHQQRLPTSAAARRSLSTCRDADGWASGNAQSTCMGLSAMSCATHSVLSESACMQRTLVFVGVRGTTVLQCAISKKGRMPGRLFGTVLLYFWLH